jgi:hypothetical protein
VTDQSQTVTSAPAEGTSAAPTASAGGLDLAALAQERPEAIVGAAFAGGFLLAMILKRLGR